MAPTDLFRTADDDVETGWHEAGHALAALECGRSVNFSRLENFHPGRTDVPTSTEADNREQLRMWLGGIVAQCIYRGLSIDRIEELPAIDLEEREDARTQLNVSEQMIVSVLHELRSSFVHPDRKKFLRTLSEMLVADRCVDGATIVRVWTATISDADPSQLR
jgi:hypothetical protein